MAVIYSYFDESGKFRSKDVVAFGGLCADLHSMTAFDRVWRRELRRANLPYLKMSDAVRCNTALSDRIPAQSPSERLKALLPFVSAIKDHSDLVLGMAIDVQAFRELKKDFRFGLGSIDDPHYIMFLRTVAKLAQECGERDFVSLICDDEEETAEHCYKYYRRVKKIDAALGGKIGSIGFGDDAAFPALQAADVIASLVRLEAERRFFDKPFDYLDLLDVFEVKKNLYIGLFDRARLQRLQETSAELEEANPSDESGA